MENRNKLDFKDIGIRIRTARENLKLSREKFAEILELSPFYIGQIERGDRKMSVATLDKIATALHQSVDYLLYGKDIHGCKIDIDTDFSIFESANADYCSSLDRDLYELLLMLSKCSRKEITLFEDLVKLILPYINK